MDRFNVDENTLIEISHEASSVQGTSADLVEGDTLTIWQLLFGLMLPSGNDSAHQLAEYFGGLLMKEA
jgi:D-alanyl-D-alanine carboxypeptidase